MDIEERAEQWAIAYASEQDLDDYGHATVDDLIAAYLAGSAQTQRDYTAPRWPLEVQGLVNPLMGATYDPGPEWHRSVGLDLPDQSQSNSPSGV